MKLHVRFAVALVGVTAIIANSATAQTQGPVEQAYYHQGEDLQGTFDAVLTNYQCNGACCDYGCSDCCDVGCCDSCGYSSGGLGGLMGNGRSTQIFAGAEYLYVRANFSEAVAFVEENNNVATDTFDLFHELEFRADHSYRLYGGCRDVCCGTETRFTYTRLCSDAPGFDIASQSTIPGVIIAFPLEPVLGPDNDIRITGRACLEDYDLGCAKTIPLGSPLCCDCGDACGCGDCCDGCCAPCCPAWDITWEGAVRYSEVDWSRDIVSTFTPPTPGAAGADSFAFDRMEFQGLGLRMGLGGRRYFGRQGCFSVFLNGDISLLAGDVELVSRRELVPTTPPGQITSQYVKSRNIIPVTELEAGVTGHLSSCMSFSAGYMLSAWHDLGMRQELFPVAAQASLGVNSHDDANILGWDGFFARLEGQF